ncbi:helicase associated domain-containing protein [Colletotrichum gloeosporioides Cg-14]|uniref:Helicase associated domain-containing protein n=1 Tax=Colletotrichum gloeosporioides (strain Cg-14) TaxID=1237896 RepID=T0JZQ6_COLGC|nr:helicase associated domain-containing protein [Colletotrichum gloeosporioides Cg-14]
MDDLLNLELLSLVSKVTSELQNHLGVSDKTLAEFIIAQRVDAEDYDAFKKKLAAIGAEFPPSLVDSVDRLVLTMHPKLKGKAQKNGDSSEDHHHRSAEENQQIFKGLAVPDKAVAYDSIGDGDAIDDTLALLEGLEGKARGEKASSRKRSRSPNDGRESRRKRRDRSRSRDRRKRDKYRSRSRSVDDYENGPSLKQRRGRRNYDDEDDSRFRRAPEPEVDDAPQLHKVYSGHVTGIKDFGAFVNLHGVRGKVDGLVHISRLVEGQRVNHPPTC